MPAASPPSSTPRSMPAAPRNVANATQLVGDRPRRQLAAGADREPLRSSPMRCARRRARPRSTARSRICAPRSPPPSRAKPTIAVAGPRRAADRRGRQWLGRGDRADRARQFRAQRPADDAGADRRGDAGHVHRLRPAHADGLAAADRRRRDRARRGPGRRPRRRARDARGRAAGQLRRSAAARAAGPRGLAPADRGHGRHHRPLRQRLDPDLQAYRVRARLGPGPAALRRAASPGSRPTGRRSAGSAGWSRPRASPGSTSTGWSGC